MSIETQKLRIVFMGMDGVFSAIPLQYLLAHGVQVGAVVTPGAAPEESALRLSAPMRSVRRSKRTAAHHWQ